MGLPWLPLLGHPPLTTLPPLMPLPQHTLMSLQHTTLPMPSLMTTPELTLVPLKPVMDMLPLEATMLLFPTAESKLSLTVLMMLMVDISLMLPTLVKPNTLPLLPTNLLPMLPSTTQLPHLTTVKLSCDDLL